MSGLETHRDEYSNLLCESRGEGDEGPHIIHMNWNCVCISYHVPSPSPFCSQLVFCRKWPGWMSQRMPKLDWGSRTCERACLFFAKCATNTESHFLLPSFAQASVVMDRYRGLCCWYTSITLSLLLRSLVHVLRRPCLPAMTNIVVSAHGTRVGLVTTWQWW